MKRGGNASTTLQDKGGGGMVLECETEELSDSQLNHIQKLKAEVSRLQKLMQTTQTPTPTSTPTTQAAPAQKQNEITLPVLVNGAVVNNTPAVNATMSNGPNMVGLQVPQFLLLQNGQMIATSSALQANNMTTTTPGSINPAITLKQTSVPPRTTSSHITQAAQRSQRVNIISGKNNQSSPVVNNNSDEIEVLGEMISSSSQGSASSRLRNVRIQPQATSTATATTTTPATTTFRAMGGNSTISDNNGIIGFKVAMNPSNSSPMMATRTNTTTISNTPPTVETHATPAAPSPTPNSSTSSSFNKYPLLSVIARPRNTLPPSVAMNQRKELDTKVKLVLVKSPQEFVEWLLSEGLIRTSQICSNHTVPATHQPYKLKLGIFSDPKTLATSGGYVWISECCGKKYVSVYSGSIFGSTPIDKVPPTSVLKLVYHWSCQTSINNVENWVKVEKPFINKMFQYLRCVCSVMLQDKVYDFGFDGTTVELGIVSLGTSTADGTKKAVKVEILGLYDRKMKSYRLFASEPEPGSSSRQRFVRILKPLERVVHTNALILCDHSVDRNCLYNMNYARVSVCEASDNENNLQYNARIMTYLRKHVPKMFQSALSQLNLQQVQLVLDELCWRERYGHCAAQAYTNMVEHIIYLTAREAENPGVLHLLDFVAQSPHYNWRYKSQQLPKGPVALHPAIIMNSMNTPTPVTPQINLDPVPLATTPLDHNNKVLLTAQQTAVTPPAPAPQPPSKRSVPPQEAVELEPYFYGQIQGDSKLGREINTTKFVCHICSVVSENNIEFYSHLKLHLSRTAPYGDTTDCCDYCPEHFSNQEKKIFHQRVKHMHTDTRFLWCRICTVGFSNEYSLVNHMIKKHHESELPYRCDVCFFVTSIFYSLVDHFNTEHKNTCYVLCHFCLGVKAISPSTSSSFSQRVYQHLQRHTHQQARCKSCQLNFYSTFLRDDHRKKCHISRAGFPGLQRYKIPAGQKTRILFQPLVKRQLNQGNPAQATLDLGPTMALTSTLEWHNFKINVPGLDDYSCMECDSSMGVPDHFKSYMKCTRCKFSTCCQSNISKHSETFHPSGRTKKGQYKMGNPIMLPKALFCICGFSSRSGNHLARHLVLCEGGRKSAYPSVSAAMVYEGDVTGGILNLTSLGNMGLASICPDVSITDSSFDMSQFMNVSMEVDNN